MHPFQKRLLLSGLVGICSLIAARDIQASSWDKACVMSVTEPIIAGGRVLAPGTYAWKLLDSASTRHIVEIIDQTTGNVAATIIAKPAYRQVVSPNIELEFWETPRGVPRPIRRWFYPGDNYGQEFMYPAKLVASLQMKLASQQPAPVGPAVAEVAGPVKKAVKHVPVVRYSAPRPRHLVVPEGSWAKISEPAAGFDQTPGSSSSSSMKHHSGIWDSLKSLPLTATLAPLVGLVGVGSLLLYLFSMKRRKLQKQVA